MWLWPVIEMIELVSGMPAPPFGDESSWVRGSELDQGWSGSVSCFCVPHVEDHWSRIGVSLDISQSYGRCEPRHLTILWASTACYRDGFTFFFQIAFVYRVECLGFYVNWNDLEGNVRPLSKCTAPVLSKTTRDLPGHKVSQPRVAPDTTRVGESPSLR
jgi:hypothetical protein